MDTEWPVERLRRMTKAYDCKLPNRPHSIDDLVYEICAATADTIERLTKERDRLKEEINQACAVGGVDRCLGCGWRFVTSDKTYCSDCDQ